MTRRFQRHDVRPVRDLSGVWDFAFLGDRDPDQIEIESLRYDDAMAVPGCFDATPGYAGARGLTAYRTRVMLAAGARYRLIFHGVSHWCRVFVAGAAIRDHCSAHTLFNADYIAETDGEADLVVLVDNRFDARRSPLHHEYFDWYHHGGIARTVELHRLGDQWIDALAIVTESIAPPRIRIVVDCVAAKQLAGGELSIDVDGAPQMRERLDLAPGTARLERVLALPEATLWSPDEPNLHLIHVRLGQDDMRERIGIRQVSTQDKQLLINGNALRLLGICRHELHPQFGSALPPALLVADLQQIRALGCNFIRGAHYPQDLGFLDLCDQMGICVWSEALGWQQTAEQLTNPTFVEGQLEHIGEMVAAALNRPSVILWGILNEADGHDPACRPAYAALLERLRALDPTRPLTFATNHPNTNLCLDLVDVIAINLYPGWYEGEIEEIPRILDGVFSHIDGSLERGKPILISELGAAAVPGWRDWNESRWTEQYQARLLDAALQHLFVDGDRVCGISIWQFCDHRTPELVDRVLKRARGFNNKGILDEYRRPKQAFDVVRRHFKALRKT